jgi:hypothetical protein
LREQTLVAAQDRRSGKGLVSLIRILRRRAEIRRILRFLGSLLLALRPRVGRAILRRSEASNQQSDRENSRSKLLPRKILLVEAVALLIKV